MAVTRNVQPRYSLAFVSMFSFILSHIRRSYSDIVNNEIFLWGLAHVKFLKVYVRYNWSVGKN